MTEEEFMQLVKTKMNETVESIMIFANHILDDQYNRCYSTSEIQLAHHLKLSVIFYQEREKTL